MSILNSLASASILVVDDHPVTRQGLTSYLQTINPEWTLYQAVDGVEAISITLTYPVDIIILDYQMPHMDGLKVAEYILRRKKNIRILLYTFLDSALVACHFLKAGGKGFVTKGADLEIVIDGIQRLLKGEYFFHSQYEGELIRYLIDGLHQELPNIKFSERELEVSMKLSKGLTARETAEALGLSVRTVEFYKKNLLEKTSTKNAMELVAFIYQHGIKKI